MEDDEEEKRKNIIVVDSLNATYVIHVNRRDWVVSFWHVYNNRSFEKPDENAYYIEDKSMD